MKKILPCLALAILTLLQSGCRSETGALEPQKTNEFNAEMKRNFVLMDSGTQHSITCAGLKQVTLPDGRLQVSAIVRNRENRRLQVQIQCEFKDGLGFAVDSPGWENLILTENSMETKSFVSLTDKAKSYTIRVREAR